ncbi:RDD family protein [Sphingomonas adhaesiva]|uniref:RDD family protein n=1 Tax=Sphingomonas adhaesiva TaxID=28212 RepID=UPI002FF903E0
MRWTRRQTAPPPSLVRRFMTPERVDLRIELGSATARAMAFLLDWIAILLLMALATAGIALLGRPEDRGELAGILWLVGLFVLRNGWFALFEMGRRGATPGKRVLGLRVIARDGGRLTPAAVIARNALREVEIFLPLSFLAMDGASNDRIGGFMAVFSLLWAGIFFLFPLFNRDRLRVGDLLAGTWVVNDARDASSRAVVDRADDPVPRRVFTDAALDLYGVYELQMLEDVLRARREAAVATVAATIRRKAGLPDDGDDLGFLSDYYEALCGRLERGIMVGRRREDKHGAPRVPRDAAA